MLSKTLFSRTAIGLIVAFAMSHSVCRAQVLDVLEDHIGGSGRPETRTLEIRKNLQIVFETKGFHDRKPFSEFMGKFQAAISKKGKEVQIKIDRGAFSTDDQKVRYLEDEEIGLPRVPERLIASTAFRLALAQVGSGKATYWTRSGQIMITSNDRVSSSFFIENSTIEAVFKNRPLMDALDDLAEQSGVSIIIDSRVRHKAQRPVTAKLNARLETAIRLLTDSAGLKHVVVDNVVYVTDPANAREFGKKRNSKVEGDIRGTAYKNKSFPAVLDDLGLNWVIDSRVKDKANIRISAKWINWVDLNTVFPIVTDMAGLTYVVDDGVVYVTSAANAKKIEEESRKNPKK